MDGECASLRYYLAVDSKICFVTLIQEPYVPSQYYVAVSISIVSLWKDPDIEF